MPLASEIRAALPISDADLTALVDRLWNARGSSLVLCDSQDVSVQILVNAVNHLLENYGKTVDIARPSRQRQGNDADVLTLLEELTAGTVSALFVAGTDLTHNLPMSEALTEAISRVRLVVSFSERSDDFASPHSLSAPIIIRWNRGSMQNRSAACSAFASRCWRPWVRRVRFWRALPAGREKIRLPWRCCVRHGNATFAAYRIHRIPAFLGPVLA